MGELSLVVSVVVLAIAFDYINGFHDTANAIATVVSTNVLHPRTAVMLAAVFNFGGAFLGTAVAKTVGSNIADPSSITQTVIAAALLGAIVWNLITWYFGIPSSSSHALVGGICGAVISHRLIENGLTWTGAGGVQHSSFDVFLSSGVKAVIEGLFLSPLAGLLLGFFIMILLTWIVLRAGPARVNKSFRALQLVSSCSMALSHGTNDAQKAMGIVTMALYSYYGKYPESKPFWLKMGEVDANGHPVFAVPYWVIAVCAAAMACGTAAGGWRIMKTMGHKIIKLKPIHGFAAEAAGAITILAASFVKGMPVSTTHVISSAIMGVGASKRISAVRWGIAGNIVLAWVLTIPVSCVVAGLVYLVLRPILGR
ncbi:inorganic phosphate transporter [bacterium]|nr:inorganic phosphate transporter [bacterium]